MAEKEEKQTVWVWKEDGECIIRLRNGDDSEGANVTQLHDRYVMTEEQLKEKFEGDKWISVETEKPINDEAVLIVDKWGYMYVAAYNEIWYLKVGDVPNFPKDNITHWRPLPLAPTNPTFVCNGCGQKLTLEFQIQTEGYCYICDPNI